MSDIPQEWINAVTDTYGIDEAGAAHILAAVLPLIADKVRGNDASKEWRNTGYVMAWSHGRDDAVDLIWKDAP